MVDILSNENAPLHFTEICRKVNVLLGLLDWQKIGCEKGTLDIDCKCGIFSYWCTGVHYGLTKWGFRKEMTPVLVEEVLENLGGLYIGGKFITM